MRSLMMSAALAVAAAATPALAQTSNDNYRIQQAQGQFNQALADYRADQQRFGNSYRYQTRLQTSRDRLDRAATNLRSELDRYQQVIRQSYASNQGGYNQGGYNQGGTYNDDTYYDPARDYRPGDYQERVVSNDERVYRGTDGRYYCKRQDGTTGLIVGGLAGGVLGNVIDGGRSRVLGTLLGGVAGALGGRAIERSANDRNGTVTCR